MIWNSNSWSKSSMDIEEEKQVGSQEEEKEKFYWVCRAKSTILVQRTDRQPLAKKSGRDMKYDVDRYFDMRKPYVSMLCTYGMKIFH